MDYTYKQIVKITIPVILSVLVEQLINITDAVFLGHVGEIELGAAAIAGIYYLTLYMIGFGFSLGLQVIIARRNGEQDYANTGRTLVQGFYILTFLSLVLISLSHLFSPTILKRFISSPEVYDAVIRYLEWRIWGLLFAFPSLAFRSFFVGITRTKVMTVNALMMVTTNLGLNYVLIFGNIGFPALGIAGAGIASTLAESISFLVFAIYAYLKINRRKFGLKANIDMGIQSEILKISVWSMMHSFISVAPWFLFFVSVEHLGQNELAISNMIRSIQTFFAVIVNALAATTASLVSNLIGAGKSMDISFLCRRILKIGYVIGIPLLVFVIIFNKQILAVYTSNPVLIVDSFCPLLVMLSNFFIALPSFIYLNAVAGIGKTKTAFLFQVVTTCVYLIYLWTLNQCENIPLAVYCTVEHLFVIFLLVMSLIYLKSKEYV